MPYAFDAPGLRRRLRENGHSKEAIAVALGLSSDTVVSWMYGRSFPRVATLVRLAEALDCAPGDLFCPAERLEKAS
jgi:transcriptional regulator with XRE-family HTH domain